MTTDKTFTRAEAIRITGKSAPTIDAYLKNGRLPNATSSMNGKARIWQIPLTDLVAAGLLDKVSSEPDTTPAQAPGSTQDLMNQLQTLTAKYALAELELRLTKEALAKSEDQERTSKALIKTFTNILETRQTQEARRQWWTRSRAKENKTPEPWTPEQD
jgi:hypothetical protein